MCMSSKLVHFSEGSIVVQFTMTMPSAYTPSELENTFNNALDEAHKYPGYSYVFSDTDTNFGSSGNHRYLILFHKLKMIF